MTKPARNGLEVLESLVVRVDSHGPRLTEHPKTSSASTYHLPNKLSTYQSRANELEAERIRNKYK